MNAAVILIDPLLLAIAVIYVYGFIVRLTPNVLIRQAVMGFAFGLGAVFAMLTPMVFSDGVIIDMRSLLVGLSGAFFGIPGALIAGLMSLITRFMLGGNGANAGLLGIAIATCAGPIWARYVRHRVSQVALGHVVLGLTISTHLFAIVLLPPAVIWSLLTEIVPILLAFNLVGTILFGALMHREEGLAAENLALLNAATTDPLTRLHNRRSAVAAYNALPTADATDHGTAMLCFDVDNFKAVNDTFGHVLGDKVLAEISSRIGKTLRPTDVFSRLGGDEFLIILPSVTEDETCRIAERCREVIAQSAITDKSGAAISVTISIGVEWLSDRPDFLTFVARADEALYQAKKLGRNCVAFAWENTTSAAQAFASQAQERIA
jgi:diguanylate cyclase